jgi:hypothetical protein
LERSFALLFDAGRRSFGLTRSELIERTSQAPLLLNVMGFLDDDEVLAASPRRVFLDIDPGFPQMWRELGLADPFAGHDRFVTIAERIGQPDCSIPTCGLEWLTTRQPVVLEEWPVQRNSRDVFTSVGVWRGPYAPVQYRGATYGLRVHEFRKFAALPSLCGSRFEAALEIHPNDHRDHALLARHDWNLVEPMSVVGDPFAYRRYIASSKAELMVAKGMYVHTNSGWISDRSACYLASGKPVLAQDTHLARVVPCGKGLITFSTLDDAVEGAEEIERNYSVHAQAARQLAEECFESGRVLRRLLEQLGVE